MAEGSSGGPREVLGWRTIWIAAAIILFISIGSGIVLFWLYPPPGSKEALDIIRTAGTLGVGTGGAAALLLHARRQQSTELANEYTRQANEVTRHDAEERRITELQAQANEQLGHEKAAVRIGALTLLKRLGNSYPDHRQEIVDIVCAYLRMPYKSPVRPDRLRRILPLSPRGVKSENKETESGVDSGLVGVEHEYEELEVRLTAQRFLAEHLRPPGSDDGMLVSSNFWDGINLDLTGATLINFSLSGCWVARCRFDYASFVGGAEFRAAQFGDVATFIGAEFSKGVTFRNTRFAGRAAFDRAQIRGVALFANSRFGGLSSFSQTVMDESDFFDAWFESVAFPRAQFKDRASFSVVRFDKCAFFLSAKFGGEVYFDAVRFGDGTNFKYATFEGPVHLTRRVSSSLNENLPGDQARFRCDFETRNDDWPAGWVFRPPKPAEDGRIKGHEGVWGYVVAVDDAQPGVADGDGEGGEIVEAGDHGEL
ncbi:pentapeptide repeat-containing protein [Saccharopolyspora sp. WRP15-2]|uniref:Pentapeptide repeat-containing protein n=1 Tax=Saccharopolyspora oryzae TaxID=2997343 RepID=A0ABT4USX3_9PSEU|nr:pentapeptide repeat-containing protein [Saccharopolyspora oryzae]MDA3624824.1 pentapeptide repeat-containing protein [Saccharopolyspora oryzae]